MQLIANALSNESSSNGNSSTEPSMSCTPLGDGLAIQPLCGGQHLRRMIDSGNGARRARCGGQCDCVSRSEPDFEHTLACANFKQGERPFVVQPVMRTHDPTNDSPDDPAR